jgi:hypothetical protein
LPAEVGEFSAPFVEGGYLRQPDEDLRGDNPLRSQPDYCRPDDDADGLLECAPAAGSLAVLPSGDVLYFNALEATEDLEASIANEVGTVFVNDQSRVMTLGVEPVGTDLAGALRGDGTEWSQPDPVRADPGADTARGSAGPLVPDGLHNQGHDAGAAAQALFCADLDFLGDGRLLVVGGTDYYFDPVFGTVPEESPVFGGKTWGLGELEGTTQARIFEQDADGNVTVVTSADMEYGRWYPSSISIGSGDKLVFSGVQKLLKPLYPDQEITNSGRNVPQVERFVPGVPGSESAAGTDDRFVTESEATANRSLPLFPRLHLLPNGEVYYAAAGQVFNPFGQAYDQALWNIAATYDPTTQSWTDLGVPGVALAVDAADAVLEGTTEDGELGGTSTVIGFRGSTFSIMLPLRADADGSYSEASFLAAGGVIGVTPGSYLSTDQSAVTTLTFDGGEVDTFSTHETGPLNTSRWYGTGVLLPDDTVMVFNGANRDEVVGPGTGTPILTAERFDPATGVWTTMATANRARTYHNTASLLPDGSVLIGGHAPITTLYGFNYSLLDGANDGGPDDGLFSPQDGRDPTFEIYRPPYMYGARPEVTSTDLGLDANAARGSTIDAFGVLPNDIADAVLIRRTSITHLVDGDQRAVVVDAAASDGGISVKVPEDANVVPDGPYLLFIRDNNGIPSMGIPVNVAGDPE